MFVSVPHASEIGNSLLVTIAMLAAAAGFAACCLAAWAQVRLVNARRHAGARQAELHRAIAFRDALLASGDERATVLGDGEPFDAGGAHALFRAVMAGPDARSVAQAVDGLLTGSKPFRIVARRPEGDAVALRGLPVEGRAALYVKRLDEAGPALDFRAALDAVTAPVWIRGADLKLRWANRAFLAAAGAADLRGAVAADVALHKAERELAASVRDGAGQLDATRYVVIEGRRRALSLRLAALADSTVACMAIDVTELAQAEAHMKLQADATADMLDGLRVAIAVFDRDRRLQTHNAAYAGMWNLDEKWLDAKPAYGTILDKLRETRRLPEQQDFPAWMAEETARLETCDRTHEDIWHLPDGRSIRIVMRPHLMGGAVIQCQDISDMLRLEASITLLTRVQRATLDTVDDGIAVFGPDGRLMLHNKVFARQWLLSEGELAGNPPLARVASLAETRLGPDGLWRIVAAGVTSDEPERCNEWGKATRTDGRIIALSMKRLPNGATAVTFCDLTDIERFQAANRGPSHAAA
ncbi:MAG TPA: PAS-domain containing protein [Rhizomicrobium sp.]|nr:PAS-domain containing protein [Rhizomicrobium sp.]